MSPRSFSWKGRSGTAEDPPFVYTSVCTPVCSAHSPPDAFIHFVNFCALLLVAVTVVFVLSEGLLEI